MWQDDQKGKVGPILLKAWEISPKGRRKSGYGQAYEHIRLIENEGYRLRTFPMMGVPRYPNEGELSPAAIAEFTPELADARLVALPDGWYAASFDEDYETIPQALDLGAEPDAFPEGAKSTVVINAYERNREARQACLRHHGLSCQPCGINFEELYGDLGAGYIHVHHIVPIHRIGKSYNVDPIKDLIPVCPNCHAMVHRRSEPLTVAELREILMAQRSKKATEPSTVKMAGDVD